MRRPGMIAHGLTSIRRFADYHGRATRTELFAFWLVTMIGGLFILIAAAPFDDLSGKIGQIALAFYGLLLLPSSSALWVRRLHDQDRTALWLLLVLPNMLVGSLQEYARLTSNFDLLFAPPLQTLNLVTFLIALPPIVFLFWPHTEAANRYGPNPRYDAAGVPA